MAKCPECASEVNHLICLQKQTWRLNADGSYALLESYMEWACPACGKVLFADEEEARKWLGQ